MSKVKLLIIVPAVLAFCFLPLINMPYEVVVQKQGSEEYTTLEPYTVQEQVQEPYTTQGPPVLVWPIEGLPYTKSGMPEIHYRTAYRDVTKYREVTKTRLVTRPFVETRTKRVSLLRYLLR